MALPHKPLPRTCRKIYEEMLSQDTEHPTNVIVKSISLLVEGRPDVTFDLTGDVASLKDQSCTIQEGASYRLRLNFCVQREIVMGLKFHMETSRRGIRVDSTSHMVGSYGPKGDEHAYTTPVDEAPAGILARGAYELACVLLDDDKNKYLEWSLTLSIKKDWE